MATRAEKKRRRKATGSAVKQTTAVSHGGSLGRKTKGLPGERCAPNVFRDNASEAELRQDVALVERSVAERWPSTVEMRAKLRRKLDDLADKEEDTDLFRRLMECVVKLERQNQTDQLGQMAPSTGINITIVQQLNQVLEKVRSDDGIVESLYEAARVDSGQPRADGIAVQ